MLVEAPRVTRKVNLPTSWGSRSMAGHALPAWHDSTMTSHSWPRNVPAHHPAARLGDSTTRTVAPALVGGACAAAPGWQPPRPPETLAVTR